MVSRSIISSHHYHPRRRRRRHPHRRRQPLGRGVPTRAFSWLGYIRIASAGEEIHLAAATDPAILVVALLVVAEEAAEEAKVMAH